MPILVPIKKVVRDIETLRRRRREEFEQACRCFIERYCADHQEFLADPKEYYRARLDQERPGAATRRGFGDDGTQASYVSPYEEEFRFRKPEAVGGYRCAGFGSDGVAIRAKQGYTHTASESGAESFQFESGHCATSKPVLPRATVPSPVKVGGRWEYPDNPNFFRYVAIYRYSPARFTSMPVEPPLPPLPSPRRPQIATVQNIRPAKSLSTFFIGEPHVPQVRASAETMAGKRKKTRAKSTRNDLEYSYLLRPADFAGYIPTDKEIRQWQWAHWKTRCRWDYRKGRFEPLCGCDACQKWWPNLERVDWRTIWSEEGDDLTTRKMRDLNARLELYRYGDHHWQSRKMGQVTAERRHDARVRLAACNAPPERPPEQERCTSYHHHEFEKGYRHNGESSGAGGSNGGYR